MEYVGLSWNYIKHLFIINLREKRCGENKNHHIYCKKEDKKSIQDDSITKKKK